MNRQSHCNESGRISLRLIRVAAGAALLLACATLPAHGFIFISEIMYNPASDESMPKTTEWVEIYNPTATAVNISGWYLSDEDGQTGGIAAGSVLAPYEAAVITSSGNTVAGFQAAWGSGFQVFLVDDWDDPYYQNPRPPEFTSLYGLANAPSETNEILKLRNASGSEIDEVNYDDEGDWPTDYPHGPSIYLHWSALDATANDYGANWRRSEAGVDGAYQNIQTSDFDGIDFGSPGYLHTVPEPSTWLLLALAGLGFAVRQRMRRG